MVRACWQPVVMRGRGEGCCAVAARPPDRCRRCLFFVWCGWQSAQLGQTAQETVRGSAFPPQTSQPALQPCLYYSAARNSVATDFVPKCKLAVT